MRRGDGVWEARGRDGRRRPEGARPAWKDRSSGRVRQPAGVAPCRRAAARESRASSPPRCGRPRRDRRPLRLAIRDPCNRGRLSPRARRRVSGAGSRCRACRRLMLKLRPAPDTYDERFMDTMASAYLDHTPWTELRLAVVKDLVDPQPGDRVLDLGCAAGAITHFL